MNKEQMKQIEQKTHEIRMALKLHENVNNITLNALINNLIIFILMLVGENKDKIKSLDDKECYYRHIGKRLTENLIKLEKFRPEVEKE